MSLSQFIQQLSTTPALWVTVLLTLGVILVNGWTDAPNAIASCVATRALKPRAAIIMAAVFNFLGVLVMTLLSPKVAETIYNMVDFGSNAREALIALCAAMFAIVVWAVLAWAFGIPTSESHALIAGLTGSAIAMHNNLDGVNGGEWAKVLFGLVFSLAIGFALGYFGTKLIQRLCKRADYRKANRFFDKGQVGVYARGAGRPEIHGCISFGTGSFSGKCFSRSRKCTRMAHDSLFSRNGFRDVYRGNEDNQICRNGYGEAGKISGICSRYFRDGGTSYLFRGGYARIHDACQDDGDYGGRRGEEIPCRKLGSRERNGSHLDSYFSGVRTYRISHDEIIRIYFLKIT